MQPSIQRVDRSKQAARIAYNRLSRWYDLLAGSTERKYRDRGLEKLSARAGETILELGFGTGHCLVSLAKSVGPLGRVTGVDLSEGMLAMARDRLKREKVLERVDLHLGDASKLEYLDSGVFDGAFMSFTLELFDTTEIPCVLQECRRVLKPNGRLVVVSMTRNDPPGVAVRLYEWFHEHMPNYADCRPILARQSLGQAGFSLEDVSVASMWGLPVEVILARKPPLDASR